MIKLVETALMGTFATFIMDYLTKFLVKSKIVRPTLEPQIPGRWILYMLKGRFAHEDIRQAPALRHEKPVTLISHYAIGIALAGGYLFLELILPIIRGQMWCPLVFGLATVALPWLWLYPSIGLGFLACKSPRQKDFIILSSINHLNFGIGMFIWIVFIRHFIN